jgi:flagellar basal body-associated protein FliL
MPDKQASAAPENAPGKKKRWPAVALVLALTASCIFVWSCSLTSTRAAEGGGAESTLPLETFVVNLSSGQRAYLRVGITLGLAHPLPAGKVEASTVAIVRDTVLAVLATGQPEELVKIEGKRQLKEQLLKALQEHVPRLAVQNVYFTEFLVQM